MNSDYEYLKKKYASIIDKNKNLKLEPDELKLQIITLKAEI